MELGVNAQRHVVEEPALVPELLSKKLKTVDCRALEVQQEQ